MSSQWQSLRRKSIPFLGKWSQEKFAGLRWQGKRRNHFRLLVWRGDSKARMLDQLQMLSSLNQGKGEGQWSPSCFVLTWLSSIPARLFLGSWRSMACPLFLARLQGLFVCGLCFSTGLSRLGESICSRMSWFGWLKGGWYFPFSLASLLACVVYFDVYFIVPFCQCSIIYSLIYLSKKKKKKKEKKHPLKSILGSSHFYPNHFDLHIEWTTELNDIETNAFKNISTRGQERRIEVKQILQCL